MCGFEPPPAGLCGRQRAPAPGLDDQGDLLQRVGREHGAHLGVARWCRLTPGITHSFSKRRGRSVWTARASWPGSAHDQQFTPSQCHSIWPYRPGMNGNPSASTWTRSRYGFASALRCSTARCCSDSCLRTALAGDASPFIFPGRKPKACQGRSATLHCLASPLCGRRRGRRDRDDLSCTRPARVRCFASHRRKSQQCRFRCGQNKGEGRMAPKCARPLSGARPSASADAIGHLGARAVCGPRPERRKESREGSSARARRARWVIPRPARRGD